MRVRSRRDFVAAGLGSAVAMAIQTNRVRLVAQDRPPALSAEQVSEFVRVAHGDLDRTKEMLQGEPGLLNATWDWGAGDFETGLGGASHMGNKEGGGRYVNDIRVGFRIRDIRIWAVIGEHLRTLG